MEDVKNYLDELHTKNWARLMENENLIFSEIEGKDITTDVIEEALLMKFLNKY